MKYALTTTHKLLNIILGIVLIVSIGLLVITTFPNLSTFNIYKVVSGSMEPSLRTGSLVITKGYTTDTPSIGDIVSFIDTENVGKIITHRITEIQNTEDGAIFYVTKGDANNIADIDDLDPQNIRGKVIFKIPIIGYILDWVRTPLGFIFLVIFPAVAVIINEIVRIKNIVEENAISTYKKKQSEHIDSLVTILLYLSCYYILVGFNSKESFSFFSSGYVLSNNVFKTTCWSKPSVPILIYPENNSTAYSGSMWDLNPYMDWEDSTTTCKINEIYYIYEAYTNSNLQNPIYVSSPLSNSFINANNTPNNTYWWRVKSCSPYSGCSSFSDPFKFTYNSSIIEESEVNEPSLETMPPETKANNNPENNGVQDQNIIVEWEEPTSIIENDNPTLQIEDEAPIVIIEEGQPIKLNEEYNE